MSTNTDNGSTNDSDSSTEDSSNKDLTDIKGIRSKTAEDFRDAGLETPEDVATAPIQLLTKVDGVRETKANEVRVSAERLTGVSADDEEVEAAIENAEVDDSDADEDTEPETVWFLAKGQWDYVDDDEAQERVEAAIDAVPAPVEEVIVTENGMYGGDATCAVVDDDMPTEFEHDWEGNSSKGKAIQELEIAMAKFADRVVIVETGSHMGMTLQNLYETDAEVNWHVVDM